MDTIWYDEYLTDDGCLCGLCGNCGILDAHYVKSPTNKMHHVSARFCLCPNGRKMKEVLPDIDAWLRDRQL